MTIRRRRTIGQRNRHVIEKRVRFADAATQKTARRIIKKYRNHRRKKYQKGRSLLGNITKWGINMGQKIYLRKDKTLVQKQ